MIYSQIFHQILNFLLEQIILIFWGENFNIFEENIINVKLAQILWDLLE